MKKTNLHFVKSKRILLAIALANTCVCGEIFAINEDTPGLSFETGFPESFTDDQLGVWKRYYGFFGAEDFEATQIVNKISNHKCYAKRNVGGEGDEDNDGWVRYDVDEKFNILDGLTLEVDERGLKIKAKLIDTTSNRDIYKSIQAGLLDKMSFAFTVAEDEWDYENNTRTIKRIDKLYDVSVVDVPFYDSTEIYARSFDEYEKEKAQYEKLKLEKKKLELLFEL